MATYLHFAPAVALAVALGPRRIGWRLAMAGACCGVMPDADFLLYGLRFDSYAGTYGHRGFTHSIGFALLVGAFAAVAVRRRSPRDRWLVATYLALCTLSHPLLDGLLDRGICNAWFWPLDGARHCLNWRPIPMQGVPLFGMQRLATELLWIGVPLGVLASAGMVLGWGEQQARWLWSFRFRSYVGLRRLLAVGPHCASQATHSPRAQRKRRVMAVRALLASLRAQHLHQRRGMGKPDRPFSC
jgi:inner membrane protein